MKEGPLEDDEAQEQADRKETARKATQLLRKKLQTQSEIKLKKIEPETSKFRSLHEIQTDAHQQQFTTEEQAEQELQLPSIAPARNRATKSEQ